MIVHKCDICNKELHGTWLTIYVDPDSATPEINIVKILRHRTHVEVCESCFADIKYEFLNLQRKKGH